MDFTLGERELNVMAVLWETGSASVAEVRDQLPVPLAYTTVLTILRNLEAKGLVRHTEEGRAHRYHPRVAQHAARRSALARVIDKLFNGSPELLLTHLVDDQALGKEELRRLRRRLKRRLDDEDGPMILALFLYGIAIGVLASLAAVAVERLLRLWRRPARGVWAAAILATAAAPLVPLLAPPAEEAVTLAPIAIDAGSLVDASAGTMAVTALRDRAAMLDGVAGVLWIAASVALLLGLGRAHVLLRRRRRAWRADTIDRMPVLVTPDVGPAVVGVRRPAVVIPRWVLDFDASLRAMILRHESEHIAGRDPQLLFAGLLAAIAAPWNAALWWQLRRLRLAVEMDCDARVLAWRSDVERYGMLLLAVGQRGRAVLPEPAAALSEPPSFLERRITAMSARIPRHRSLQATGLAVVAAALVVAACEAPLPTRPTPRPDAAGAARTAQMPTKADANETYFEFQVEKPVTAALNSAQPRYPDSLRTLGVEGEVLGQFVVDTAGRADRASFKVLRSTHEGFVRAVTNALPQMRWEPAEVGGRRVKQLVQQPFTFAISKGANAVHTVEGVQVTGVAPAKPLLRRLPELRVVDSTPARAATTRGVPAPGYTEFRVEKPATALPGSSMPRYPDILRSAGVEGEVLVAFVVDADGTPDMGSFRVLRSSHTLFTDAVRDALPGMRFAPAEVDGRKVRQLIRKPFTFALSR